MAWFGRTLSKEKDNTSILDMLRNASLLPINTKDALNIMWRVPRRVKDDDSICANQINPDTARFRRDKEQTSTKIGRIVESIARACTQLGGRASIEPKVVLIVSPCYSGTLFQQ